jgi:ornithine cyclodeaminase
LSDDATLLLMPAWQAGARLGVKLVTVAPNNPAKRLPSVHSVFLLFDAVTGVPLALLDGEELTLRRTAAASALASCYLSRSDSETLLMVGTGSLAPYLAEAHCAVRPIRRLLVWGRTPQRAEQLVQQLSANAWATNIEMAATVDLATATAAADIISCATTSTVPIVRGADVRPGTHLDLVGGFKPNMREADDDALARATVFVDTFAGALAEAGDLVQPLANGRLQRASIVAELADLCGQHHAGRTSREEITVFKSVGTAIEDLCAANLAWEQAPASASR